MLFNQINFWIKAKSLNYGIIKTPLELIEQSKRQSIKQK